MEMDRVTVRFLPEVEEYLLELCYILYEKEYFGFLESAFSYVDEIVDFAETKLPLLPFRETPKGLKHLGRKYTVYSANANTAWYIFFDSFTDRFIVKYITNNHTDIVKTLNNKNF